MTDTTELALLAGVCAEPAEDAPRLVYADWLQENGQERAATFIRDQIAGNIVILPLTWATRIETVLGCQPHQCGFFAERGRAGLRRNIGSSFQATYVRGFPAELICSAVDFLRHGDALIWRPGATMECDECLLTRIPSGTPTGRVAVSYGAGRMAFESCPKCSGTGRIPRPCPPTAQPITQVTLTTWPDQGSLWGLGGDYPIGRGDVQGILEKAFRGVTFTLPPQMAFTVTVPVPPASTAPIATVGNFAELPPYVACGNHHVPASGYTVEVEGGLPDVIDGTDSKSSWPIPTPSRAVFTATYTLASSTPMPPTIGEMGTVFGPITGVTRTGQPVRADRAILRNASIQMQGNHVARVTVEAVAVGALAPA